MLTEKLTNKVVIHLATDADLPAIYGFADNYDDYPVDSTIEPARIREIAKGIVDLQSVLMGTVNGETIGVFGGYIIPCLFTNDVFFQTMFFYVIPKFRRYTREFLKEAELALTPTKVTRIVIGIAAYARFGSKKRFMKMMGYKTLEEHFYKRI